MKKQDVNRYFPLFIYVFCFIISVVVLWQGRSFGLFPMPSPGMDQLNFLDHAQNMLKGILPDYSYKLSFSYTVFLAFLSFITGGKILIMRILQIALCSLIPVVIYKLCRLLRCSFIASQIAALLYCFYGTSILVSIGFLRAAPLALCFIGFVYLLVKGFYSKKYHHYLCAGLLAGLAILGRENFIPIVLAPLIMLFFPVVRKHVSGQKIAIYLVGIFILIAPLIMYNYIRFDAPELIPGNFTHIFKFYHGEKTVESSGKLANSIINRVPSQVKMFASSYEAPNSLALYAHREIISLLNVLRVPFNLILAMAILALFLDFKHLRSLFIGGMATGYFLTIIYFSMFYRFRVVDVPLLLVLCGIAIRSLMQTKSRKLIYSFSAIFVILFFFMTYTHPNKIRTGSERRSVIGLLISNKDYYRAEKLIDGLIEDEVPLNNIEKHLVKEIYNEGYKEDAKRLFTKYNENIPSIKQQ